MLKEQSCMDGFIQRVFAKPGTQAGFSLIEVVVAMAVFIIGVLGVIPMLAFNIKANASGKNYGIATYLAQQKLEQFRSWPMYEDYDALNGKYGITENNPILFPGGGTENNLQVGEHHQHFTRITGMVRNGYPSSGWTQADTIFFANSGYASEGTTDTGASLNTGTEVGEKVSGSTYRGEDFKMIRVEVQWDDLFGHYEVVRHMYIAKF